MSLLLSLPQTHQPQPRSDITLPGSAKRKGFIAPRTAHLVEDIQEVAESHSRAPTVPSAVFLGWPPTRACTSSTACGRHSATRSWSLLTTFLLGRVDYVDRESTASCPRDDIVAFGQEIVLYISVHN